MTRKLINGQLPLFLSMALLGGLAWLSISRIQFSANLYEMLPRDLPEVQGMDWLNRFFSQDGQLMVTVASDNADLTSRASAALAEKLRQSPDLIATVREELPLDRLAREGGSLLAWLWLNAAPDEVAELASRLEAPHSGAAIAEAVALLEEGLLDGESVIRGHDPLALARLPQRIRSLEAAEADAMSSKDGRFRLFFVKGTGADFSDYRKAAEWLTKVKGLAEDWQQNGELPPEVAFGFTGTPAFMAEVGAQMERDMTVSVLSTMALIAILFWVMHRQMRPLGWLVAALFLILIATVNVGALLFGKLSVMSAGFAAIVVGLTVDYAILLYREAMAGASGARELRATAGFSIAWAALSTAVVFLALNFSSLPGLAQMGNLVTVGVVLGALIMMWGFAPVAVHFAALGPPAATCRRESPCHSRLALTLALLAPLLAIFSLGIRDFPRLEPQFHPFRIRTSPSMKAWTEMQHSLRGEDSSVPVVITARSLTELEGKIGHLEKTLQVARDGGSIRKFVLPLALIPRPGHQAANRAALAKAVSGKERLLAELEAAGFSTEGQILTREVLESWERSLRELERGAAYATPSGPYAEWTVSRLFSRDAETFAALGAVLPRDPSDREWIERIYQEDHAATASLSSLGKALNQRIVRDVTRVFIPMLALLVGMLGIVFCNWRNWLLALFTLVFGASLMMLITLWTPLSWNSFNICGAPLLLGTGMDFGIHMILALSRAGGDIAEARRHVGKALLFCGGSSAIGFGSLAFSSAQGLASLGLVCAAGIAINMVTAVWLLPIWYRFAHGLAGK